MMGVNMVAISSLHQIPLLLPDLRLYARDVRNTDIRFRFSFQKPNHRKI